MRVWRRVAFGALLLIAALQLSLSLYLVVVNNGTDFGKLYFGWHQANPYDRTPATLDVWRGHPDVWYRNLNPPHVFLVAWPLSLLPHTVAWSGWFALQILSIAWLVRYTIHRGSGSGWPVARSR